MSDLFNNSASLPVTVIVPVLDEAAFIGPTLQSILDQDFPQEGLEILVIDGGSSDNTVNVLDEFMAQHPQLRYLHNSNSTVPFALNLGIRQARGEVIMRMDCHSIYPASYISTLVRQLHELNAQNVGGVVRSLAPDDSCKSEAIATAMASRFGVGNALFRVGTNAIRQVDTVPFGCYPRQVFEDIGGFDVALTRNQDDEFNARLIRHGGRIFLIPSVEILYYTRTSLSQVWRMFYQYGLYKPLVNRKCGALSSYRQLAPPALVFSLCLSIVVAGWLARGYLLVLVCLGAYLAFLLLATFACRTPSGRFNTSLWLLLTFPTIHLAYGIGYWRGIPGLLSTTLEPQVKGTSRRA